jgi:hypothetical protein
MLNKITFDVKQIKIKLIIINETKYNKITNNLIFLLLLKQKLNMIQQDST